jgi:hypothetical protein
MAFPVLPVVLVGGLVLWAVVSKKKKDEPRPEPEPEDKCPEGQIWSVAQGRCVPRGEQPKPPEPGDVIADGKVGHVGWRVIFAYHDQGLGKDIYITAFIDPTSPTEVDRQWFEYGWTYNEVEPAVEDAKKIAQQRPWLDD